MANQVKDNTITHIWENQTKAGGVGEVIWLSCH